MLFSRCFCAVFPPFCPLQELTKQNGEGIARSILAMSEMHTCPDPERFVVCLRDMFNALDPERIRTRTSEVLQDMIEQLRQHQVTLKATVSTVVVTTLVLEGWSKELNPDLHIMDALRDMLAVDWKERLSRAVDKVRARGRVGCGAGWVACPASRFQ